MGSTLNGNGWKLEVVRGKDAGRVFALTSGEVVLGNADAATLSARAAQAIEADILTGRRNLHHHANGFHQRSDRNNHLLHDQRRHADDFIECV